MLESDTELLADLLESLEETYQEYLEQENFNDNHINRTGFYMAALEVVREAPLEDEPELQAALEDFLERQEKAHRILAEKQVAAMLLN